MRTARNTEIEGIAIEPPLRRHRSKQGRQRIAEEVAAAGCFSGGGGPASWRRKCQPGFPLAEAASRRAAGRETKSGATHAGADCRSHIEDRSGPARQQTRVISTRSAGSVFDQSKAYPNPQQRAHSILGGQRVASPRSVPSFRDEHLGRLPTLPTCAAASRASAQLRRPCSNRTRTRAMCSFFAANAGI